MPIKVIICLGIPFCDLLWEIGRDCIAPIYLYGVGREDAGSVTECYVGWFLDA